MLLREKFPGQKFDDTLQPTPKSATNDEEQTFKSYQQAN